MEMCMGIRASFSLCLSVMPIDILATFSICLSGMPIDTCLQQFARKRRWLWRVHGLYSYGLHCYSFSGCDLCTHGLYSYGLHIHGLYSPGL